MLIELWRKETAEDYSITTCAICGDDFDRGSVFPVIFADQGEDLGEMCPTCLGYLNRRKVDAENPIRRGNQPACDWPTLEALEEARRRYPTAMFETSEDLLAAADGPQGEEKVYADTIVWEMVRVASVS